jgi:Coagulation Factor Xa inhibitory site
MRTWLVLVLVCAACEGEAAQLGVEDENAALQAAGSGSDATAARRPRDPCARDNGGCEQICRNMSGRAICECAPGAYLESDRRSCWQWHDAQRVESYDGGDANEPRVVTSSQGEAVAVWTQAAGSVTSIWSSRTSGAGWGGASQIDGADPRGSVGPQLVAAEGGRAVALWRRFTQTIGYTANLLRAGAWGTPEVLLDSVPSAAFFGPALSGSRNGAAVVAWGSTAGRGSLLRATTLSGTTWTEATLPLGPATAITTLGNIRAGSGPNGEGSVLWSQRGADPTSLWLNQFRNGAWGTTLQVDLGAAPDFSEASLAVLRGPVDLVVWIATESVWANQRAAAWSGAVRLRQLPAATRARDVRVVSDSRGENAFAIWVETGTGSRVWTSGLRNGTWSAAVELSVPASGNAQWPQIALEPGGSTVAVWAQQGARFDIWANRYQPGVGWGTAVRIENDDAADAWGPSVAVDARGRAFAVWPQSDGTRVNVLSNRAD